MAKATHVEGIERWILGLAILTLAGLEPLRAADLPSNGWIVWASTRGGQRDIYRIKTTGKDPADVVRLTTGGGDFSTWSPDGRWIAYHHYKDGTAHVMRPDGSGDKKLRTGCPLFWMYDGSGVVCSNSGNQYGAGNDLYLVDPETGKSSLLLRKSQFSQLNTSHKWVPGGITHDGRWLVTYTQRFKDGYTATNGYGKGANHAAILDLKDKSKLYIFAGGCEPTTPPAGNYLYHMGGTRGWPDTGPMRMHVSEITKSPKSRTTYTAEVDFLNADWGHEYTPRVSNDNVWLAYMATTGCHSHDSCDYEIFVHRLGAGVTTRTRITFNGANDRWPSLYVGALWQPAKQPTVSLSATDLSFTALEGAGNPAAKTVTVTNAGTGTLQAVTVTETAGWLSVKPSGSGNNQTLANTVEATGLKSGTFTVTVQVASANATNSPQSYKVTLTVTVLRNARSTIEAESFDGAKGVPPGTDSIGFLDNGDWVRYANVDFGTGVELFEAHIGVPETNAGQKVEVRLDAASGKLLGTLTVQATGDWGTFKTQTAPVTGASGVHDLYLVFKGSSGVGNLDWIRFGDAPVAQPSIAITSPKGGEVWPAGSTQAIQWTSQNLDDIVLQYSTDNGATWKSIDFVDNSKSGWGNYPWVVPDTPSTQVLLKIEGYFGEAPTQSKVFEITSGGPDTRAPSIALLFMSVAGTVDDASVETVLLGGTDFPVTAGAFTGEVQLAPGGATIGVSGTDAGNNTTLRMLNIVP